MVFYLVLARVTGMSINYNHRPHHIYKLIVHDMVHYFILFNLLASFLPFAIYGLTSVPFRLQSNQRLEKGNMYGLNNKDHSLFNVPV